MYVRRFKVRRGVQGGGGGGAFGPLVLKFNFPPAPKQKGVPHHAKAGNMNHALGYSTAEFCECRVDTNAHRNAKITREPLFSRLSRLQNPPFSRRSRR